MPVTVGDFGLPGDLVRPRSTILGDAAPLVGGDALIPCDEAGDLTGEGERLAVDDRLINCKASPELAPNISCLSCSTCSACTTSANEMKLNLRGSVMSNDPYPCVESLISGPVAAKSSVDVTSGGEYVESDMPLATAAEAG